MRRVVVEVAAEVDAPRAVRRVMREVAMLLDVRVSTADLELLVSETVTNAVELRAGAIEVELEPLGSGLRVRVRDRGPGLPTPRSPGPSDAAGRGLLLLDRLASRWGVEHGDDSKVVWFDLPSV